MKGRERINEGGRRRLGDGKSDGGGEGEKGHDVERQGERVGAREELMKEGRSAKAQDSLNLKTVG